MTRTAVLLLGAFLLVPSWAAKGPSYKISSVEGGTLTADGKAVEAGAGLAEGATVRLDKGTAVVELGDEGRLRLTGPAELLLGKRRVELKAGALLSVLPRLRSGFSVATPVAVAAVRGTEFFIEARDDGRTYLCLCEGVLEVTGAGGLGYRRTIRSKRHAGYIFSKIGKRLDSDPWRMEHHTDAEIGGLK